MKDDVFELLERFSRLSGDDYVDAMVMLIMPLLAEDERSVDYALKMLAIITDRSEFRKRLEKRGAKW